MSQITQQAQEPNIHGTADEKSQKKEAIKCKKIGNYVLAKTIGKGTFGKVKIGIHLPTQQKVAIKILDKAKIKDEMDVERISREIHILKLLRHRNIAQLYETVTSEKHIYLIMEYAEGGDLFEYINSKQKIEEYKACRLFQQLISTIEYIHTLGIVHRDIKPENILLDSTKTIIKLVDFGLSNSYKHGDLLKTACGSPCYASPEMISGKLYNGLTSDLWSCGVVLYCMLCGTLPFDDDNIRKLYRKIIHGEYRLPDFLSAGARDILSKLLETETEKRIRLDEIRDHSWFNIYIGSVDKGILIGLDTISIDMDLVREIKEKYYKEKEKITYDYISTNIKRNVHNNLTTVYYLLFNKRAKEKERQMEKQRKMSPVGSPHVKPRNAIMKITPKNIIRPSTPKKNLLMSEDAPVINSIANSEDNSNTQSRTNANAMVKTIFDDHKLKKREKETCSDIKTLTSNRDKELNAAVTSIRLPSGNNTAMSIADNNKENSLLQSCNTNPENEERDKVEIFPPNNIQNYLPSNMHNKSVNVVVINNIMTDPPKEFIVNSTKNQVKQSLNFQKVNNHSSTAGRTKTTNVISLKLGSTKMDATTSYKNNILTTKLNLNEISNEKEKTTCMNVTDCGKRVSVEKTGDGKCNMMLQCTKNIISRNNNLNISTNLSSNKTDFSKKGFSISKVIQPSPTVQFPKKMMIPASMKIKMNSRLSNLSMNKNNLFLGGNHNNKQNYLNITKNSSQDASQIGNATGGNHKHISNIGGNSLNTNTNKLVGNKFLFNSPNGSSSDLNKIKIKEDSNEIGNKNTTPGNSNNNQCNAITLGNSLKLKSKKIMNNLLNAGSKNMSYLKSKMISNDNRDKKPCKKSEQKSTDSHGGKIFPNSTSNNVGNSLCTSSKNNNTNNNTPSHNKILLKKIFENESFNNENSSIYNNSLNITNLLNSSNLNQSKLVQSLNKHKNFDSTADGLKHRENFSSGQIQNMNVSSNNSIMRNMNEIVQNAIKLNEYGTGTNSRSGSKEKAQCTVNNQRDESKEMKVPVPTILENYKIIVKNPDNYKKNFNLTRFVKGAGNSATSGAKQKKSIDKEFSFLKRQIV